MKRTRYFAPALLWALVILGLGSIPSPVLPAGPSLDKLAHFGMFAVLGALLAWGLHRARIAASLAWLWAVEGTHYSRTVEAWLARLPHVPRRQRLLLAARVGVLDEVVALARGRALRARGRTRARAARGRSRLLLLRAGARPDRRPAARVVSEAVACLVRCEKRISRRFPRWLG